MNVALIFAGGVGRRMNSSAKPKQFLELFGKPIIIYTIELFQNHPDINGVVVVCVDGWVEYLKELLKKYGITKVKDIVVGGETGQSSIYNGLLAIEKRYSANSKVLIHDGVRPLINHQTISDNIAAVAQNGTAITTAPTIETFVISEDGNMVDDIPEREKSKLAKAPQSFILSEILDVHRQARIDGIYNFIDSCSLMKHYGKELHLVEGPIENIKITTPMDFFIFRAIYDARENAQILGI
ncbi:2-C-methyl-D-erythritol 4-phosphate cytidylyltransferase [Labilibacter sediminis]|nr:2-C-methyl-D-erythritol 4-phosphate cytidylyltransferase [Labilibacter sediminis]